MLTEENVSTEDVSLPSFRALVNWLNGRDTLQFLLGRQAFHETRGKNKS